MRTHVRRIFARPLALIAAALLTLFATSCGSSEPGGESVFLYVVHGYAGAQTMSLIGPGGPVVNNLAFGERADGPTPIEVDRTLGSEFTLILDGTPQPVEFEKELFSLYPQETATLFISRRSGSEEAQATVFRHVQSISQTCLLTLHNSLSLDNTYSTTEFTFYPELNLGSAAAGGYFDEAQELVYTECGPINDLPNPGPIPRTAVDSSGNRVPLNQVIDQYPWFFPVECSDAIVDSEICFHWGTPPAPGQPTIVYEGGVVIGPTNSRTYLECVEGAITIKQPEDPANPLPFPPQDAQVQCPDGAITWDDVNVDGQAVRECKEFQQRNTEGVEPAQEDTYNTIGIYGVSENENSCSITFRVRTALLDVIFGPNAAGDPGIHQNGGYVVSDIEIPIGSEHFFVLFGRPVNPLVWQWNSGETFADLRDFPYFNGQDERLGDYSDGL